MVKNPEIRKRYQKEVADFNKDLGSYEQIKKFELMQDEWTIQSGELTANLKLRRNYICHKYESVINKIFDIQED